MNNIKARLSNDFQLAIVSMMGAIALLGISPFMVLRVFNGQWQGFFVDLAILLGIFGIILYAWIRGRTRLPSLLLAYFIGLMGVVAIHVLGTPGRYWFFPAILACFFLVDRRHALIITSLSLLAVLFMSDQPIAEMASFSVTVIVCALLSYTFAYRTEVQRRQLEMLATKDALTGAANRHLLLDELERAHRQYGREQSGVGILILDLDYFKSVNDEYGHLAGDRVLVQLAKLLEGQIRRNDRLFRYGGEEFVILVQGASEDSLDVMARKLRGNVEGRLRGPNGMPVTVSIGGALLRDDESIEAWFARADAALYACKTAGRNQVRIDPEPLAAPAPA